MIIHLKILETTSFGGGFLFSKYFPLNLEQCYSFWVLKNKTGISTPVLTQTLNKNYMKRVFSNLSANPENITL